MLTRMDLPEQIRDMLQCNFERLATKTTADVEIIGDWTEEPDCGRAFYLVRRWLYRRDSGGAVSTTSGVRPGSTLAVCKICGYPMYLSSARGGNARWHLMRGCRLMRLGF